MFVCITLKVSKNAKSLLSWFLREKNEGLINSMDHSNNKSRDNIRPQQLMLRQSESV